MRMISEVVKINSTLGYTQEVHINQTALFKGFLVAVQTAVFLTSSTKGPEILTNLQCESGSEYIISPNYIIQPLLKEKIRGRFPFSQNNPFGNSLIIQIIAACLALNSSFRKLSEH